MPLQELLAEPPFMNIEEHARLQEATPSSFQGHPPVLRLKLMGVRCCIQPEEAIQIGESSRSAQNGNTNTSNFQEGTLWVTESQVSFLPPLGKGFSLDYPSLSLHAVSRSLPSTLETVATSSPGSVGCLYCQLEGVEDEEEEQAIFPELWILPADQESLEPLFEALSYCASLHPSITEEDDAGGGHPFSSVGPFGTGLLGGQEQQVETDGAFDDAEEGIPGGEDVQLSETGRATLARLDSLLEADLPLSPVASASSVPASFHSADPRKAAQGSCATNSLILVHLPEEIFTHPPLAASLLDLLHAFGDLASWSPLPSFGRALIVYQEVEGAQRAKEALDRLLLPLVEEGRSEEGETSILEPFDLEKDEEVFLRAYFGPMTVVKNSDEEGDDRLAVPVTDRNFLISPPGSPPIGWEPIKEDPPNRDTLADDLIRALGSLRDKGLGVQSHQPEPLKQSDNTTPLGTLSAPTLVIPPSQARVQSWHPLTANKENSTIDIPGVMVQSVDGDQDDDDALDQRMNKGLSISSVKATVESMKGSYSGSDARITPTGRPPLSY